jgi:hypothetical protein
MAMVGDPAPAARPRFMPMFMPSGVNAAPERPAGAPHGLHQTVVLRVGEVLEERHVPDRRDQEMAVPYGNLLSMVPRARRARPRAARRGRRS